MRVTNRPVNEVVSDPHSDAKSAFGKRNDLTVVITTDGMTAPAELVVLRLGHRPGRDDRMTTHVALTARALGADRVILPDNAHDAVETAKDVTDRFGGLFTVETTAAPVSSLRSWDGLAVHLTMYGLPIADVEDEIRTQAAEEPVLVVVGSEKVPFEVYETASFNVGVTNQPHSEVAALAVALDRLYDGAAATGPWPGATKRVVPQETGKRVVDAE